MTRCMRRIIACFALFAVAWVALLPLVSSAHALVAGDSSLPPCHQAGLLSGVHTPSSADPAAPGSPCAHCAFCIAAIFILPSPPAPVALVVPAPLDVATGPRPTVHPADLATRLPDPRGPPPPLA
jgi:hypothetical protein